MNDNQIIENLTQKLEEATKPKWVSVDDRLPDEDGIYLTTTLVGSVNVDVVVKMTRFVIKPAYSAFSDCDWHKTIGWQPLPEAMEIEYG